MRFAKQPPPPTPGAALRSDVKARDGSMTVNSARSVLLKSRSATPSAPEMSGMVLLRSPLAKVATSRMP